MTAKLGLVVIAFSLAALPSAAGALELAGYRLQLSGGQQYRLPTERPAPPSPSPRLAGRPYATEIAAAAHQAGLDPALVHAVIHVESAYRADAVSEKGARGLMQLMPDTARRFGVADASEPRANLLAGTRYLRFLLDKFDQRVELALAAYNAGEGAIAQHAGNIPPYPETQRYVPAVLGKFNEWRSIPATGIEYAAGIRLTSATAPSLPAGRATIPPKYPGSTQRLNYDTSSL